MTQEEIGRLQDEILALHFHNQELLAERSRLQASGLGAAVMPPPAAASAQPADAGQLYKQLPSAAALGSSLSSRMKVGTGAFSAFGARGVASLQSTFKKGLTPEGAPQPDGGLGGLPPAFAAPQDDEAAALSEDNMI